MNVYTKMGYLDTLVVLLLLVAALAFGVWLMGILPGFDQGYRYYGLLIVVIAVFWQALVWYARLRSGRGANSEDRD
jgi:hypothetical protein